MSLTLWKFIREATESVEIVETMETERTGRIIYGRGCTWLGDTYLYSYVAGAEGTFQEVLELRCITDYTSAGSRPAVPGNISMPPSSAEASEQIDNLQQQLSSIPISRSITIADR